AAIARWAAEMPDTPRAAADARGLKPTAAMARLVDAVAAGSGSTSSFEEASLPESSVMSRK
ncbi:hypothetical protein M1843_15960, partial [Isoptericola sp. 4D.3]|nr:hypothetical protein [Isoptericola sp. 4D.3]